jgi:hypothetical protein
MTRILTTALAALALGGCFSLKEPTVETTKSWEGRYTSLEAASKALDNAATTENDHQVWILQPSTLNRLLKNVSGK